MNDRVQHIDDVGRFEGIVPGQLDVEGCAQSVDVAAGVDGVDLAAGLLRRHEPGGAHDLALGGDRVRGAAAKAVRDPEVGQARAAVGVEQDVLRLDVAVNDALGVRVLQGDAHVSQSADDAVRVEIGIRQVAAAEVLHGDVRRLLGLTELVDLND